MNKTIQSFSLLRRAALTLLVAVMAVLTAGATEFITDVMLIGGTDQEVAIKKELLKREGWKVIDQDLNAGCGSSSDYIYLLYKTADNFTTPNLTFITGFYISNEKNYSDSYYFNRNRYYLVPYDGGDHFKSLKGDLNSNAGGDDIHLYYTKEHLSDQQYYEAVTGITFNKTKKDAVGVNGGSTGYDLNAGCGSSSDYIYMHLSTAVAHGWGIQKSSDNQQCYIKGCSNITSVKSVPAIIEGAVVTGIFIKDFQNFTNLETFYFYEGIDISSMPLVSGCTKFAYVYIVDGSGATKKYNELPTSITTIPDNAFAGTKIKYLEIPDVTSIGSSAFSGCSGLKSFTIPEGVATIGSGAFSGCTSLTSVTINSNAILSRNYSSSSSLKDFFGNQVNTYTIGNAVTSIGKYAFSGCSGLTSITIPESVTSIGVNAFQNCSNITSATIGSKVSSIGAGIFAGCPNLETLSVAPDNVTYDSRESCNAIIESSSNTLIVGCKNTIISNGVTSIGGYAFSGCSGLTSVTIPEGVATIGIYAFEKCTNLTSVTINSNAILSKSYSLSSSLKHIFGNQVNTYTIGNAVTSIGGYAFNGCSGLTSVTIPNSVTNIRENAFRDCSGLTSVTIGSKVRSIGGRAFAICPNLETISVDPDNATYDSRENCNAIIESSSNTLIAGCKSTIIPESVTSIGNYAFYYCSGLPSVTIPNSVTNIGENAFGWCSGLTSVTIGNSVTSIGNYAFYGCI